MSPSRIATQAKEEIRHAILFYECRGWCWLSLVDFLLYKYNVEGTGTKDTWV